MNSILNKRLFYEIYSKRFKLKTQLAALLVLVSFLEINANSLSSNAVATSFEDAQQNEIKGVVTDNEGIPLPGVSIVIKGTAKGTTSEFEGDYSINASKGDILVFSYLGMFTKEVLIENETVLNITLQEDASELDEVVIVGYGMQKKANLTGAVSTIGTKDIEERPITNLGSALQGLSPGLNVSIASGQPGSDNISIQIRGASSANGNVQPLILLDGVPTSSFTLQTINPADVESVTVLKDAAAASIYGAEAAGGVMLITTKSGVAGKIKVNFSSQMMSSSPLNLGKRLGLLEEAEYSNLARANAGVGAEYSDFDLDNIRNGVEYVAHPTDSNKYIYYHKSDVRKVLLRENSMTTSNNLSISGGSEKTKFLLSLAHLNQDGLFKVGNDNFKRFNYRLNIDTKLTKYLSLSSKISYAVHNRDQPSQGTNGYSFFQYIQQGRGRYPIFTPEGRIASGGTRAYGILKEGGYTYKDINELDGIFTLSAKDFIKGVQVRAIYGKKHRVYDYENFKRTVELWGRHSPNSYLNNPNSLSTYRELRNRENFQFLVDYDYKYGKHSFHVLGGYQWEDYRNDAISAAARSLVSNDLPALNLGAPESKTNSQSIRTYAKQSYFGRINYNFDGKYLLEATIRTDETSRLAPGLRTQTFPSVSAGWNIHKENWFANLLPFVSEFKPRYSWGQLGNANANIIGYYDYLPTLSSGSSVVLGESEDRSTYYYQSGVPSSTLSWETVETSNYGVDLAFFNNKLSATFDYFIKHNKNMLIPLDLPATYGVGAPKVNDGELKAWGWELDLRYRDVIGKNFSYNIGLNVSDNQNELVEYGDGRNIVRRGNNKLIQGYPLNTIWGYKTVSGYIETQEQLDNSAFYSSKTGIGDMEYIDMNGDNKINAGGGTTEDSGDLVNLGTTNPRYSFGFTTQLKWKNIDFSFFLQGVGKRNFTVNRDMLMPYSQTWFSAQKHHADYWTPENTGAAFPRPFLKGHHNYATSDRWVLNGAYMRLKNIQIGYTLPRDFLDKIGIENLKFYAVAKDILTFSKMGVFEGVFDPEQRPYVRADYPLFGTVGLGMNLSF
ncbi:MAG: TonB-dependent receptor [Cellulophaga sp.]